MSKLVLLLALLVFPLLGQKCEPQPAPVPVSTFCYGNDYTISNNVSFGYDQEGIVGGLAAILQGDPSNDMRSTVQVLFGQAYCTGVVLSPTVVLTAGHCGYGATTAHTVKTFKRDSLATSSQTPAKIVKTRVSAKTGLPTTNIDEPTFEFNSFIQTRNDGGIVIGDPEGTADLPVVNRITLDQSFVVSSHIVHPDYLEYTRTHRSEKRKADLMILHLATPLPDTVPSVAGFYNPKWAKFCNGGVAQGFGRWEGSYLDLRETKYIITTSTAKYLISRAADLPQGEQSGRICFGDSGGPLYMDVGGVTYLAGITTTTMSTDCLTGGTHVNVLYFQQWIIDTVAQGKIG